MLKHVIGVPALGSLSTSWFETGSDKGDERGVRMVAVEKD